MVISIIGLGLIGGSLALDLRANGFASKLIGVEQNPDHQKTALELQLVDEIVDMEKACMSSDIIILAVPVSAIQQLLPRILDQVDGHVTVIDMGSTKQQISQKIATHPNRSQCVIAHPMAGTEYSGPKAAINNLFHSKAAIICEKERSGKEHVRIAERLFKSLFMRIIYMNAAEHDVHAAYVSHVSHITSFVLALTVLEKEKSEANIFNLASGGFASTVRLAKSSAKMWRDVFEQNSENVLDVLESYITKMALFKESIQSGDFDKTFALIEEANKIGPIIDKQYIRQKV